MDINQDEYFFNKRKRKVVDDLIKKWVVVIIGEDVNRKFGLNEVFMLIIIILVEINRDII